jgi:hypothetical protein
MGPFPGSRPALPTEYYGSPASEEAVEGSGASAEGSEASTTEVTRLPYAALTDMVSEIHSTAVDKGWWEPQYVAVEGGVSAEVPRNFGEVLALIHSEVSEALEAYREGAPINQEAWEHPDGQICIGTKPCSEDGLSKPVGVPSELADIFIRVADACGAWRIDLAAAVAHKVAFNKTRAYRHGEKLA